MIKKFFLSMFVCFLTTELMASSCGGKDAGYYVSGLAGGSFLNRVAHQPFDYTDIKPGYLLGIAVGYRSCYSMRLEGEFTQRTNGIDIKTIDTQSGGFIERGNGARVTVQTYMANVYAECKLAWAIRPYVGIGGGYAHVRSSQVITKPRLVASEDRCCYQLIGGFSFPVWRQTDLSFEYRYLHAQKNSQHHAIAANIRYFFY